MVTTITPPTVPAETPPESPTPRSRVPIVIGAIAGGIALVLVGAGALSLALGSGGTGTLGSSESAPAGGDGLGATDRDTDQDGSAAIDDPASAPDAGAPTTAELLSYLIEEEKLAHDVYLTLGDLWGVRIFDNITQSETQHQNEVATVMTSLGVADPRIDQVGVFADPSLQELYDRLVAQGSISLQDAYQVGVTIEELDIADLQADMAAVDDPLVLNMMQRLLNGSTHHLAAFQRQL